MLDVKTGEPKKTVEKKKHPWVVNILKKFIGGMTITKRILDLKLNLTIGELLVLAPVVKKQCTKAITEEKALQFEVNTLKSSTIDT